MTLTAVSLEKPGFYFFLDNVLNANNIQFYQRILMYQMVIYVFHPLKLKEEKNYCDKLDCIKNDISILS